MNYSSQKKFNVVTSFLARDFFTREIPSRLPTITEYCEVFNVSRGVVQDALANLEKSGCIELHKHGSRGSFLVGRKQQQLYDYTMWDVITGTMPAPLDVSLQGLATGLCNNMSNCDIPFSFAFILGAQRRAKSLSCGLYDFSIVSAMSARYFIKKWPKLKVIASLHPSVYSYSPYYLIMNHPGITELQDGMRVLYDPYCYDETLLTQQVCREKKVELIEDTITGARELFERGVVDAMVFRQDSWMDAIPDISIVPLDGQDGSTEPILLANQENYCIDKLLTSVFMPKEIADIQREVKNDQRKARFF